MRRFLKRILTKPVIRLANKWSSRPDKNRVDKALTDLYDNITTNPGKRGLIVPFDAAADKFVIFSDQHKGARDGADVFRHCVNNYLAALEYYNNEGYTYINLGDSEELWGNIFLTIKRHNKNTFEAESEFLKRKAFIKIFGNHDLYWDNDPLAIVSLLQLYGEQVKIYEGAILKTTVKDKEFNILLTHGHQGDLQSDGNWFSKWFVSDVWGPLQSYLHINPNTPAYNDQLKTDHNRLMYEWSSKRKDTLLITGHTHQPVFRSMTELESMYDRLSHASGEEAAALQKKISRLHLQDAKPPDFNGYLDTYFNTGCCCFDDGDITGIEIDSGCMRLIKWTKKNMQRQRVVLEECKLEDLKL
jgi:predicted phosphodiesterase